ncbi:hypothetical protein DE146DRAFT_658515 [Phaeosphaeria sp. MPI-PUGE-AT-0046c]|nr:hypothetical protein DE146DRAFT_658515 [Phaeosphaeria sp. MPI-PUGE-AT-0046c]
MAHQAYALPWQSLADNFKFVHANTHYLRKTNLYPRSKPGQGKQLNHFVKVFARVLEKYSTTERMKYKSNYSAPGSLDEIVLPDTTLKNIRNVVSEYMKGHLAEYPEASNDPMCRIERTMSDWIAVSRNTECHPGSIDLLTDELLRTLLLYGEMDVLFRIVAHPDVELGKVWAQGGRFAFDLGSWGLAELKEAALLAYICLNVFYLKPELYDPIMREQMFKERSQRHVQKLGPEFYDYRLTSAYQQMLVFCTGTGYPNPRHGAHKIPHREFYGVPFGMYTSKVPWHSYPSSYHAKHYGMLPLHDLIDNQFTPKHVPSKGDIILVQRIFRSLKMPTRIILRIFELADYTPKGRLHAHADPLHIENTEELKKYLAYCWKMLVRVEMLMKENGTAIDWEYEVAEAIYKLFGVPYPRMSSLVEREEEEHARLVGKRYDMRDYFFPYWKKRVFI